MDIYYCWLVMGITGESRSSPPIEHQITVEATIADVWTTWTTKEGLESFFGREVFLDLKVGGKFVVYFYPEGVEGPRGTSDLNVLVVEPEKRFAFTWDAPISFPEVREQRAFVEVIFTSLESGITTITLRHIGWGDGEQWVAARNYFERGWQFILGRYENRVKNGPVDWTN